MSTFAKEQKTGQEIDYKYKAKKYHEKIRSKLIQMQKAGGAIPEGYANYLIPFDQQMTGGNINLAHKARKYHEKTRYLLENMQKNGQSVPAGYEKYLVPFDQSL